MNKYEHERRIQRNADSCFQNTLDIFTGDFFSTHSLEKYNFCEYIISNSNETADRECKRLRISASSQHQNKKTPSSSNPNKLTKSDDQQAENPNQQAVTTTSERWLGKLWSNIKTVYYGLQVHTRPSMILAPLPQNTFLNIIRMILIPILLVVIVIMLTPLLQDITRQTLYAILYNCKLPDNRNFELKRVAVGVSLIFEHAVKKLFPLVRLRWASRNQFRRRAQVAPHVPPTTQH